MNKIAILLICLITINISAADKSIKDAILKQFNTNVSEAKRARAKLFAAAGVSTADRAILEQGYNDKDFYKVLQKLVYKTDPLDEPFIDTDDYNLIRNISDSAISNQRELIQNLFDKLDTFNKNLADLRKANYNFFETLSNRGIAIPDEISKLNTAITRLQTSYEDLKNSLRDIELSNPSNYKDLNALITKSIIDPAKLNGQTLLNKTGEYINSSNVKELLKEQGFFERMANNINSALDSVGAPEKWRIPTAKYKALKAISTKPKGISIGDKTTFSSEPDKDSGTLIVTKEPVEYGGKVTISAHSNVTPISTDKYLVTTTEGGQHSVTIDTTGTVIDVGPIFEPHII
ncbi:hypothetical protein A3F66_02660 [candidate division TM6 bacterium RIFCSPHIGHO2_12_FULL_32_22]|nr:MAG: hypothetical protein A3F66_02660 [candidate division TM6 bacterium RIFCSPHIGHO2_12_FULL_32_22]